MSDNCGLLSSSQWRSDESSNGFPRNTPASTSATPISEASTIRPGRITFIHSPVKSAAGMVTTMVKVPQALSLRALTTTMAEAARVAMTMKSMATRVMAPQTGPRRLAAIFGNDRPSWRTEASRMTKS